MQLRRVGRARSLPSTAMAHWKASEPCSAEQCGAASPATFSGNAGSRICHKQQPSSL
ncbi:hypothetical protein Barb4_05262 [Bacteroidales bacterium Barb4]|nr:hypothetical protein Barb4_05262 [Bacteroidales bacterium Barb4]